MKIRAGFKIAYDCAAPCPIIFLLNVRPEREADLLSPQVLTTDPEIAVRYYNDLFGNVCARAVAPQGLTSFSSDFLIADSGEPDPQTPDAAQHPVEALPESALVFLLASRYCETEGLLDEAWRLFGGVQAGWPRVQAVVDYVHKRIEFDYARSRPTRTAVEAHAEQVGVCRDYAHLAIAFCRALNIPARYCTGYLGDIGVPAVDVPMDFSAWFQVYLGGQWRTFDARHNKPRIGRIMMAYGRDATDVAISTSFGPARLAEFTVLTDETAP